VLVVVVPDELVTIVASVVAPLEEQEDEVMVVSKVAVTFLAALMVSVQVVEVPLQAPLHPVKELPLVAAAVSVTLVPEAMLAEQVLPQEIPPVLLVTVPEPVPAGVTVSV
jgi:hypothetical protein